MVARTNMPVVNRAIQTWFDFLDGIDNRIVASIGRNPHYWGEPAYLRQCLVPGLTPMETEVD